MRTRTIRPRSPKTEDVQRRIDYTCPKKVAWRSTVIKTYREIMGQNSLPPEKQYWTMPNKIYDGDFLMGGRLLRGCEFYQIIQEGLVTPDQCHGVERVREIYENNLKVPKVHSYLGDFLNTMDEHAGNDRYNPGVVMYDSVEYPDTREDYFPRIMYFLTALDIRNVLLVWNFVIKSRFIRDYETNGLPERIHSHELIELSRLRAEESGCPWDWLPYAITYRGSGKGHQSTMATAFYYRKG